MTGDVKEKWVVIHLLSVLSGVQRRHDNFLLVSCTNLGIKSKQNVAVLNAGGL